MSGYDFVCEICTQNVTVPNEDRYSQAKCQHCGQEYVYDEGLGIALTDEQKQVLRKYQEAQAVIE